MLSFDGVKQIEDAFAGRGEIADESGVAVLEDDVSTGNDHHCISLVCFEKGTQSFQASCSKSLRLRRGALPFDAGKNISVAVVETVRWQERRGLTVRLRRCWTRSNLSS